MKFKRIIAVMLILCSVFALAACGSSSAEETAKKAGWEKNKSVPFIDYVKDVVAARYAEVKLEAEIDVYYTIKLSQDEIKKRKNNDLPVTFTVAVDGVETYAFDMLLKNGVYTIQGGKNLSQNQSYEPEVILEILSRNLESK